MQLLRKIARTATALGLMLLLCMLVMMNQIMYGSSKDHTIISTYELIDNQVTTELSSSNPAGPDEKVPENANGFSEEYEHENEDFGPSWFTLKAQLRPDTEDDQLTLFLMQFTPPPESAVG